MAKDFEKLVNQLTEDQIVELLAPLFNEMGEVKTIEAVMEQVSQMSRVQVAELIVYLMNDIMKFSDAKHEQTKT